MPKRIQRKRTKGWRMPENTVYVGRPSRWGNPYEVGDYNLEYHLSCDITPELVIALFGVVIKQMIEKYPLYYGLSQLRGKDLCCWCPLDQPCHAAVLLEMANE